MGLFEELMKRMSKPKDIKLPNESGSLDPRLPRNIANTIDVTKGAINKVTKPYQK
jgi:hypothetical protein